MNSMTFSGKHYESGLLANWLRAEGHEIEEHDALGASGGIAFGYFVFEYKGYLPHVALLPRNTFSPLDRAMDNLGIARNVRETTDEKKGEANLRKALDFGEPVVVWADMFSAPWNLLPDHAMWLMAPILVVGHDEEGFWVVDRCEKAFHVDSATLNQLRGRVKKDRYRLMTMERYEPNYGKESLETCCSLFLEKPPAGSAKNFGISGMENFRKCLLDTTTKDGWAKKFEGNEKSLQAVLGSHSQPGVYEWIENWGTEGGADRGTFAKYLDDYQKHFAIDLQVAVDLFNESRSLWTQLANDATPDSIPEFAQIKKLRSESRQLRFAAPTESIERRTAILEEIGSLHRVLLNTEIDWASIRAEMASHVAKIAEIEHQAAIAIRKAIN